MGHLNINIPLTEKSYYTPIVAKQNEEKIKNVIIPRFGKYIDNISVLTNVPAQLIQSIIFIESGGNQNASSPYAVGLMQVGFATASDTLVKEKGLGRLRDGEIKILKKYLGSRYSLLDKVKPNQKTIGKTFITKADLLNPEFNILVGSILLKQLIDEFSENTLRLDKVVVIYNGGRTGSVAKKIIPFKGTTDEMITQVPKETANYIKKLIGNNGVLTGLV